MRTFASVGIGLLALLLSACGGDTLTGNSTKTTPPGVISSIALTSDSSVIPADGSSSATIKAVAKDANNNAVSGATITFASSAGNVVVKSGTTDASGTATATLAAAGAVAGTAITVTATAGGVSANAKVTVAAMASSIAVTSDSATIPADGSSTAIIKAVAKDANNNAVSGVTITFASNAGNVVVNSGTTDATGTATATLTAGGAAAGTAITVTATAGGVSGNAKVTVASATRTLMALTDVPQIPSDGTKPAKVTALVRDANNNVVPGVSVAFQASSGALIVSQPVTDSNGQATATLTAGSDPSSRKITVNATAGAGTSQLSVAVTGTTLGLSCPANLVVNNTASCGVVATNSAGQGIPNAALTVSSANNNMLSATALTTDNNGRVTFTLKGVVSGADTVSVTGLGLTQQATINVSSQSFNITAPADMTKVNLGTSQNVSVTWLNAGAPVVNQPVTFATTRGTLVPATPVNTDANGKATVAISSTGAGPSIVQASAPGVSAQLNLDFIANNPSQISVQAGPASVSVQGQSTISATVRDANNNLVEGATVVFQIVADPTNGTLSSASAQTDAQGRAQVVYTAGKTTSGANGVNISASVNNAVSGKTTLTVGGQTVFLSFGTGNTIDAGQGTAIYQMTYTLFAVDSHGAPLPNTPITFSVLPTGYGKGVMIGCSGGKGNGWFPQYSTSTGDLDAYPANPTLCKNEDTDYTGNINSGGLCPGPGSTLIPCKDYNQSNALEPGNIAVVSPSSGMTDANGRLDVKVTWPRDHSYWVQVKLVATTIVQGTESSASSEFLLTGVVDDYKCTTGPPGAVSPYGQASSCANKL
jgi:hypothetical protein